MSQTGLLPLHFTNIVVMDVCMNILMFDGCYHLEVCRRSMCSWLRKMSDGSWSRRIRPARIASAL